MCIICLIILYLKIERNQTHKESLVRSQQKLTDENIYLNATVKSVNDQKNEEVSHLESSLSFLQEELNNSKLSYKTLLSQKKSSEVRLGHIAEKLAPFLDYFTFDPECATFLGQPIDYIVFEDDAITFVEIKSGNSQLSAKQRHIRDLVKDKKIHWKEIRIK